MAESAYVRVRDNATGHHYTITRRRYDLNPSAYTELKSPALDAHGDPAPVKFHTTADKAAAKSSGTTSAKSGQKAETEKE